MKLIQIEDSGLVPNGVYELRNITKSVYRLNLLKKSGRGTIDFLTFEISRFDIDTTM